MPEGVDIVIYEFCRSVVKHIDFKCVDIFSLSAADLCIIRGQILPHYIMHLTKSKADMNFFFFTPPVNFLLSSKQINLDAQQTIPTSWFISVRQNKLPSYVPMALSKFYIPKEYTEL